MENDVTHISTHINACMHNLTTNQSIHLPIYRYLSEVTTSQAATTVGVSVSTTMEQTTADHEATSKQTNTLPTTTFFKTTIKGKHYYCTSMALNLFPSDVRAVNIYFASYPNR